MNLDTVYGRTCIHVRTQFAETGNRSDKEGGITSRGLQHPVGRVANGPLGHEPSDLVGREESTALLAESGRVVGIDGVYASHLQILESSAAILDGGYAALAALKQERFVKLSGALVYWAPEF
ncbi:hypothetical protein DM40_999 [Burkholderia cenocepacia]|nr:hypothetical protein DM40_999 [Burkholderia cenocepacia]